MICEQCKSDRCRPRYFHLCPSCNGEGCFACTGSLIPGIVDGEVEEGSNLIVCSDYQDPEIEAAMFDTRDSLIEALTSAKASMMQEEE